MKKDLVLDIVKLIEPLSCFIAVIMWIFWISSRVSSIFEILVALLSIVIGYPLLRLFVVYISISILGPHK